MMPNNCLTDIFCQVDDFCKLFFKYSDMYSLPGGKGKRKRLCSMSVSEIMTIEIMFQISSYKTFKDFYIKHVLEQWTKEFPKLVSYNRFVELKKYILHPLLVFVRATKGQETGKYFIDSTALPVCDNHRIHSHRVFNGLAKRGKTSTGWFFGFKLHVVINNVGQIMNFTITSGNENDTAVVEEITQKLKGLLVGDRGYISEELDQKLAERDLALVTKVRKNMKPKQHTPLQESFLRKRGIIETFFGQLKEQFTLEHTRHRSPTNFIVNTIAALAAYFFKPERVSAFPDAIGFFSELVTSN